MINLFKAVLEFVSEGMRKRRELGEEV